MLSKILKTINNYFRNRTYFDDGSYIQWADREGIYYHEKDHLMYISFLFDWEAPSSRARIFYEKDLSKCWLPPHSDELISSEKKNEIKEKITSYCKEQKFSLRISDADPEESYEYTLPDGMPPSKYPIGSSDGKHRRREKEK